ncbi:uncharacterized protein LOC110969108 isoform X1 [Acanthochromis polyacanthus]|uniref:uncharacterized protein LOC110969108 isoform X1 n=2 Tax=Acanthochromis polyacanthus TaxID=80966 RepID=UPI002234A26E|nr:uncharacterized protein LOC110969108 isoform X1 [Acanthochromis polyacanthus]XP_051800034.1 uncharacterized protein LOC110969108 isoform X1 [Acanthochromis polyacanthus]
MQYKYKKESDIQVTGCLVHYILTDGEHPYQATTPYSNDPLTLFQNLRAGTFTLQCEERHQGIIGRMLCKSTEARPTIEECLQAITSFTHQADHKGVTNNSNNNGKKDQTHIANCSPQASNEIDTQHSANSDQPGSVCNVVMDSSSHIEDDTEIEPQISLSLDMSEEEDDIDDEPTEVDDEVAKKVITKKAVKTGMKTDENVLECSLKGVKVKMSSNTPHKRVYDKKNYCLYCEKPFRKVTRHLMRKHQDEVDIAKALAHKQGSTMRSLLLSKIRNKGKYIHNCSVKSARQGQMVPKRQTTYLLSATDFLPCYFCLAMYIRTDLWRHQRRCKLRPDGPVKRKVQTYYIHSL